MRRSFGKGFVVVLVGCMLPSCALYDLIVGKEPEQKRVAAQRTPVALKRDDETPSSTAAVRTCRVRVHATPRYAAAAVDWQRQFDRVVRDVNPTLRSDFGIELEVVEYRIWSDAGSEDSLPELLQRLAEADPGRDVDWVIALATAVPGLAESPDQLGLAETPGKHAAIRAMSDPDEFDAIERGFPDLSPSERDKLYASRKRHKSAIVLLHELGHTLGIPHETVRNALMNAHYSQHASDFSPEAIRIGKTELARRYETAAAPEPARPASSVVNASEAAPPSVSDAALEGLSDDERRLFHAAVARKEAQHWNDAWRIATPLFARHEKVYAVQKLRCDLAMAIGGAWENIRRECDLLMKLQAPSP